MNGVGVYRVLAVVAALTSAGRMIWFRMMNWIGFAGWPELCAFIGVMVLFWIGTQKMRRKSEVLAVGLLGSILVLVHELPFASVFLEGFAEAGRPAGQLVALGPAALLTTLVYLSLRGIVGESPASR